MNQTFLNYTQNQFHIYIYIYILGGEGDKRGERETEKMLICNHSSLQTKPLNIYPITICRPVISVIY
jgi:hypothetical protein